jgi:tetratricopeptide (TPR) repeat protein
MLRTISCWLVLLAVAGLPVAASAYTTEPKKAEEPKRRPTIDYSEIRRKTRSVDVQIATKRAEIRSQLLELIKYEQDPKEVAALKFRLAENYYEEATDYFNQAQEQDDELAKDPTNEKLRAKVDAAKKALRVKEDEWRLKAIEAYREVANTYKDYPERDKVLFFLGSSLWDMDKKADALTIYKELIGTYPKSKFVPDAYLAFAEYYFEQATKGSAMLEKALIAYKKVAEYEDSEVYPYAIYKQGWCYYNMGECEQAKDKFQTVIYLEDMEGSGKKRRFEIRKEALKDFTLTYSREGCGSAQDAPRIFGKLAPKEAHDLLVSLANLYFGTGQDKKSIILYKHLIGEEKCSPEVPFYQGRVVECASRLGKDSAARRYTVQQVRELVDLFQKISGCIAKPTDAQKNRIKEARELAELTLRRMCNDWYKEARETKQKETFEYAQEMCGDYLELSPDSVYAYDIRFAYAEMLYHWLKLFERAATEYSKIVAVDLAYLKEHKKFPEPPKDGKPPERTLPGTYLCDASYKTIMALREVNKAETKKEKKARKEREKAEKAKTAEKDSAAPAPEPQGGCQQKQKLPLPKSKQRFIEAARIYMDHCPSDQDYCPITYDIANSYYDYHHFDEALKRFDAVVDRCPDSELADYSANLVLEILDKFQCDMDGLNKYADKYFQNAKLMAKNEKLRAYLQELIPKIAFKRIEVLEEKLRKPTANQPPMPENRIHRKVAYEFIGFVKKFRTHELAPVALFNAGVEFEKAERLDLALKARRKLVDEFPKSDLVPGTIFNLAENYERMADYDKAASLYETYASRYKEMAGLGKAVSYKKKPGKGEPPPKKQKKKEQKIEGNKRTWNVEDAQAALLNAGIYREALRQYPQAVKDREEFIALFPDADDTPKVVYSLGLMFEKTKKYPRAIEMFLKYADQYGRKHPDRAIGARMKAALLYNKLKKFREAERAMQEVLAAYRKLPAAKRKTMYEAAEAAAHAEFIQSEPLYSEYVKYKFNTSDPKKVKPQLDEKTRRLEKVKKAYEGIVKLGQAEWAIASLYKLGRAYEDFAETYYKAPLPAGLTPEQKQLYLDGLRQMGQPWEDKAVAHFEAAVVKGSDLGFYSQFTQRALEKLQHYRSDKYPREDLGFNLSVVADTASRSPILVATWDEVMKNPALLDEAPLQTERKERPEPRAAPEEPKTPEGEGSAGGDKATGEGGEGAPEGGGEKPAGKAAEAPASGASAPPATEPDEFGEEPKEDM